ncbi:MAG TPA: RpiB/LacA/LacB family sugar-phosphate isomerase [Bryobacteraceae bacterium]|jgi:hypothetical protein|nr:RpiB/LacA/LacB family sugar-phosphate isomerase [Bryobacteraceae bacterium]
MRVSIGADHAGYDMKTQLIDFVRTLDHTVHDVGTFEPGKPDDYPDYAILVAEDISVPAKPIVAFSFAEAGSAYLSPPTNSRVFAPQCAMTITRRTRVLSTTI